MKKSTVIAFLIIAVIGVLFLGKGITGMFAISQSCCFGESCSPDNLCDAAEASVQSPSSVTTISAFDTTSIWLGIILLAVAGTYLFLHQKNPMHR